MKGQDNLQRLEKNYLKNIFKRDEQTSLEAQLKTVSLFPTFFNEEYILLIQGQVTLQEIQDFLKQFKREKSVGPDGWTVELFLHFFDIMGK